MVVGNPRKGFPGGYAYAFLIRSLCPLRRAQPTLQTCPRHVCLTLRGAALASRQPFALCVSSTGQITDLESHLKRLDPNFFRSRPFNGAWECADYHRRRENRDTKNGALSIRKGSVFGEFISSKIAWRDGNVRPARTLPET